MIGLFVGLYGELLNATTKQIFVIKDHLLRKTCNYDTAILLIRNPYDAIRADYNFRKSHDHIGVVKDERLLAKGNRKHNLQFFRPNYALLDTIWLFWNRRHATCVGVKNIVSSSSADFTEKELLKAVKRS